MLPESIHLNIGLLLFKNLDQTDLTGPFEVLSRLPSATHRIYAKSIDPAPDMMGLRITPDAALAEAPQVDILQAPGGRGQGAPVEDEEVLGWLRSQAEGAKKVLSVCTGALRREMPNPPIGTRFSRNSQTTGHSQKITPTRAMKAPEITSP